jgi:hypothetical protein
VVEEDAGEGEEVVAFAVVDGDEVAVGLGDAVGAAGIEGVFSVWGVSMTLPNISEDEAW